MARPGRQERNRTARSLRQLTRFHHGSNSDEVFGTHRIRDKPTAPASPWQNGFAERLIGSIRRECVDHIIVLGEVHLRRVLKSYADYYNNFRTHRSLNKDTPVSRPVQRIGSIKSQAVLGGLHHHYARAYVFVHTSAAIHLACSRGHVGLQVENSDSFPEIF